MEFTFVFVRIFFIALMAAAPLMIFFILAISLLGLLVGRLENWSRSEALYYAFITATTVGYGDFRPVKKSGRLLAIIIAFFGLAFTGIVVALVVHASTIAFRETRDMKNLEQRIQDVITTSKTEVKSKSSTP